MVEPLNTCNIADMDEKSKIYRAAYYDRGLEMLKSRQVALVMMAGGEGTRLGFARPKGLYEVELNGRRQTLFEIYALRMVKFAQRHDLNHHQIAWYIIVSDATEAETRYYFEQRANLGLHVILARQSNTSCLDEAGQPLIANVHDGVSGKAVSPNGSGGVYEALQRSGALGDMANRGITHVQVCNVDNLNCRLLDPVSLGLMSSRGFSCMSKAITGDVSGCGLFCLQGGKPAVVEYFEATEQDRELLKYGNIGVYFFELSFLQKCADNHDLLPIHMSHKKIPYYDPASGEVVKPDRNNGYKQETFIFDLFCLCPADKFGIQVVDALQEFAPIKNATGQHTPEQAVERYLQWGDCIPP